MDVVITQFINDATDILSFHDGTGCDIPRDSCA